jgi:4'-phosphopantetheinyl transferase EntD
MPIFFQQDIDENTRLGIWKIGEEADFFLRHVPLQKEITHPHKRLQHLAGRYLLRYLFPDFPVELIRIADTRKPFLENERYHFSISHCGDFAAVIVSATNRVGIDIEFVSQKIARIRHKFISADEDRLFHHPDAFPGHDDPLLSRATLIWSCKEAIFKWYGTGAVDFRGHMEVKSIVPGNENNLHSIVLFKKNEDLFLGLHSYFFDDLCLSYVLT